MTGQVPSVGRVVHYRSRGSADGVYPPQCVAAMVTRAEVLGPVTPGEHVALAVFNPTGLFFDDLIRHDESLTPGTWHWPGRDGACPEPKLPEFQ